MSERIKLFTDSDLDGISCAILSTVIFNDNVDIIYCNPKDVDKQITDFIESKDYEKYNKVFITDLVIKEATADLIDGINNYKFRLLDHHRSNYVNTKYNWVICRESLNNRKTCGTELLWCHFKDYYIDWTIDESFDKEKVINQYVEFVRLWDTWDWTKAGDAGIYAKELNTLFNIFSPKKFNKNIVYRLNNINYEFISPGEYEILEIEEARKKRYIAQKMKSVKILHMGTYDIAYVFAENYISELGNHIAKNVEGIKYSAIINCDTSVVSLRAIEEADVNLAEIAKSFSSKGGGHPLSAGFVFEERLSKYMVEDIFGLRMCECADEAPPKKIQMSSVYGEMRIE